MYDTCFLVCRMFDQYRIDYSLHTFWSIWIHFSSNNGDIFLMKYYLPRMQNYRAKIDILKQLYFLIVIFFVNLKKKYYIDMLYTWTRKFNIFVRGLVLRYIYVSSVSKR